MLLRLATAFEVFGAVVLLPQLVSVENGDGVTEGSIGPQHLHQVGQQLLLVRRCEDILRTQSGCDDDALLEDVEHVTFNRRMKLAVTVFF